jgi:hypothetical protein
MTYNEQKTAIKTAMASFPDTFGLRGFPEKTFRISASHSYFSGKTLYLYTEVNRDGKWLSFSKATFAELEAEIAVAPRTASAPRETRTERHNALRKILETAFVAWAERERLSHEDSFATEAEMESIKSDPLGFDGMLPRDAYKFLQDVVTAFDDIEDTREAREASHGLNVCANHRESLNRDACSEGFEGCQIETALARAMEVR